MKNWRTSCATEKDSIRSGFGGRLVVITRTLDDEEHFKSQVGLVLRKMEEEQRSECTVILWSIHHVAVVVVSGGNISHSDPVPVAAALRMDREKLVEGIKLIAHYLPPVVADESAIFVCRLPLELVLHVMEFFGCQTVGCARADVKGAQI